MEKLVEESREFQKSRENEELADILEVIHAIIKEKKTTLKKIEKIRKQKRKEKGAFEKKSFTCVALPKTLEPRLLPL